MIDPKYVLRKTANRILGVMPAPLVRYVLKSYAFDQKLQNRIRYHVHPFRFDAPMPNVFELDPAQLSGKRALAGIIPELAEFDALIDQLKPYAREIHGLSKSREGNPGFSFQNDGYGDFDAVTLYAMIRLLKPRRMIEVGCGYSSRMTTMAALKNREEGRPVECTFVEPFPPAHLLNFELSGNLIAKKIQDVPLQTFAQLESGDILFIDTTHVLKAQSDVCCIFQDILPLLAKGVYIHFHDIFTPYDYPEAWLLKSQIYYNEQYVLEAVLCNSSQFEILLPVHALWRDRFDKLAELLPGATRNSAAFWIRKKP